MRRWAKPHDPGGRNFAPASSPRVRSVQSALRQLPALQVVAEPVDAGHLNENVDIRPPEADVV